jgi:hypothetical protein
MQACNSWRVTSYELQGVLGVSSQGGSDFHLAIQVAFVW